MKIPRNQIIICFREYIYFFELINYCIRIISNEIYIDIIWKIHANFLIIVKDLIIAILKYSDQFFSYEIRFESQNMR